MIVPTLTRIADDLLAGVDPLLCARQLIAQIERVADLERKHESQTGKARAVVEKLRGAWEELAALENEVEARPLLPVDGTR